MHITRMKLDSTDLNKLVDFLIYKHAFDYENHSTDMTILSSEEFYFRNNSTQTNTVIAKLKDSAIYVDIIGSGGSSGLFKISWGSEKSFTSRIRKALVGYADAENTGIHELK